MKVEEEAPKEWVFDDAARARVEAEMRRIDRAHSDLPRCRVCGQHVNRLDKYGLCSKTSEVHQIQRGVLPARKAGARR